MARLVERILIWVAGLVTAAAIVAVALNFLPGALGGLRWLHLGQIANESTNTTIDLAEQAMTGGDARNALKLAQRAMAEHPSDASVANRAGNVALRAGNTHAAEKYYLAGESADQRYTWNFVALGQLYEREGKKELADEQLRAASGTSPDQAFIHYDLGVVEMEEGLYAAALADFDAELKRSPTYRPALIGRAEALEKMGRKSEAVALYLKAGLNTRKKSVPPPKLSVTPLVQPSPSPTPTTTPSPKIALASAKPGSRPTPSAARSSPTVGIPAAQVSATRAPAAVRPPWATAPPVAASATTVATAPTASAKPLSEISADARSYLLDVAQDLDFTRSLPAVDSSQSTATLRSSLIDALAHKPIDIGSVLDVGTAALLSGRLPLASAAFNAASDGAPRDWRGPYFAGLTAQAGGDTQQARALFGASLTRQQRAEVYTSIALVDVQEGNMGAAAFNARWAAAMNTSYEPGRFVAGMIDLIQSDVRGAQSNLSAAQALGGSPSRTAYFLTALHDIAGAANVPGG